jgi:D-alanine-D-alanine ligase
LTVPLRVLHLTGSAVSDFFADLSRLYAADCLAATEDPDRYTPLLAHVSPDRSWRFPASLDRDAIAAAPALALDEAVAQLRSLRVDVALPQMFCLPGMTEYRALLDVIGIPYVGNRPDVMALGAHKVRARSVVAAAGVDVPRGMVIGDGAGPGVNFPAVVKPVDGDNSVGVSLVRDPRDLAGAIARARAYSDAALVETYVELGREVRCGIIERGGELVVLPLEEYAVDPQTKPIRDHDDKLRRGADGELGLVAKDDDHAWIVDPDDPIVPAVARAARRCHAALGCRHYSLFDFRIDPEGRPWFLEAGLYCSFARQSVISVMAASAGIDVPELLSIALDDALAPALRRARPERSLA